MYKKKKKKKRIHIIYINIYLKNKNILSMLNKKSIMTVE